MTISEQPREYLWWRPQTSEIPVQPGVYRFQDDNGRVIYVGKAKSLRSRLVNYFQNPTMLHPRTAQMVAQARSVQWTIVATEIEALTLEFQWIKEFKPRFNVMFRDDKSYPYLAVSMGERYPRAAISRDAKRKGTRYYGPYAQVWAIRETIDLLLGTFPVRTCSAGVLRRAEAQGRPCLLGYIDRCSAPCVGKISEADHRALAEELCSFMEGKTGPFIRRLESEMRAAATALDFELAAKKRDELAALEKVQERNAMVLSTDTDADVYGMVGDELDVAVYAFYVRGGRVRGTRGWVIERSDDRTDAQLMRDLLEQTYLERSARGDDLGANRGTRRRKRSAPVSVDDVEHTPLEALPPRVLVSIGPTDQAFLEEWLGGLRGAKVKVSIPQRGRRYELMQNVLENARHSLKVYKTRRSGDLTQRAVALEELQEALDLKRAPLRIECFDISHTAGQDRVASMVVFEDGVPRKDAYRTFNIRGLDGDDRRDDTAAMNEVLTRRFSRVADQDPEEEEISASGAVDPDTGRPRCFAYRPDLLVVDGGLPQVNEARAALNKVGVDLPVVGLAKRLEEVWIPGEEFPVILPRTSAGLYLLQHLRDESHRFAIKKHRAKRSKGQTRSALDVIPGLGPARQSALLKAFGSVKRIRQADAAAIAAVPGVGPKLAQIVAEALHENADSGGAPADPGASVAQDPTGRRQSLE